ncbi:hypothetical protein SDC9_126717 [bioreactor metagenome]|uniref:Uncharacterized protein n=1 Tax=bioreactor metagenome TaxID=1076179 RepID=A0A645CS35_9ZZZZ
MPCGKFFFKRVIPYKDQGYGKACPFKYCISRKGGGYGYKFYVSDILRIEPINYFFDAGKRVRISSQGFIRIYNFPVRVLYKHCIGVSASSINPKAVMHNENGSFLFVFDLLQSDLQLQ